MLALLMRTALCGDVVLNEWMPDPSGADDGSEWIELYGREDVDLSGWTIAAATRPDAWHEVVTLPEGLTLRPGDHLVVAGLTADVDDATDVLRIPFGASLGNAGSDADAIRLSDASGAIVDEVVYGEDAARFPEADARGPAPTTDGALAREPDGGDLVADVPPSPGTANPEPPPPCVPVARGAVLISELEPDPDGEDAGAEWVELLVVDPAVTDLGRFAIEQAGAPGDWGRRVRFVLPDEVPVVAGARLVIADASASLDDGPGVFRLSRGASLGLGNGQDAVRLVDCAGRDVDTVIYGGDDVDGFVEDDGTLPVSVGPEVRSAHCLARLPDATDSDRSVDDVHLVATCTPGAPNEGGDDVGDEPAQPAGCVSPRASSAPVMCGPVPNGRIGPAWASLVLVLLRRRAPGSVAR